MLLLDFEAERAALAFFPAKTNEEDLRRASPWQLLLASDQGCDVWKLSLIPLCASGYMARYNKSPARQAVSEYMEVAKKHGLTPTELAIAWCNQRWTVTSTIIGATSMKQLKVVLLGFP